MPVFQFFTYFILNAFPSCIFSDSPPQIFQRIFVFIIYVIYTLYIFFLGAHQSLPVECVTHLARNAYAACAGPGAAAKMQYI